jgi:hypothetical protein
MGFRFRRSIRLAPGVRVNLGSRGISLSAGVRGASVTVGPRGTYANVGIPGTGISYRERLSSPIRKSSSGLNRPSSDSTGDTSLAVLLSLKDDGSVEFKDSNGNILSPGLVRIVREQQGEAVTNWLQEQCEAINQDLDALLTIHLATPTADTRIAFIPERFDLPRPQEAAPRPLGILGRLFHSRHRRIEAENALTQSRYLQALAQWREEQAAFEARQEERRRLIEERRLYDPEAMQAFLSERLSAIRWPRETLVDFDVLDGGKTVYLDIDLPEIEDLPKRQATVAAKGVRLNIRDISDTQCRRNYMIHVHAVAFRLIGEVFAALPSADHVVLSGYSQRLDKATGRINDEYLYSVRVNRQLWRAIDFNNLDQIDVVESLARFDLRRRMTTTGIFRPIEPFGIEQVQDQA